VVRPPPPPGAVSPATIAMKSRNIARIEDFIFLWGFWISVRNLWDVHLLWRGTSFDVASLNGEIFGERGVAYLGGAKDLDVEMGDCGLVNLRRDGLPIGRCGNLCPTSPQTTFEA